MIHHTRRLYPNDDIQDNGVISEHLAQHIRYNLFHRPGTAFFVDGVCISRGQVDKERCTAEEKMLVGIKAIETPPPYK